MLYWELIRTATVWHQRYWPFGGPPELKRFLFGRGLGEAEALLDGEALLEGDGLEVVLGVGLLVVVEGAGLLVVEGIGLLVVVGDGLLLLPAAHHLLPCAAAGVDGLMSCSHVTRDITPAASTNTTTTAIFTALVFIAGRIVCHRVPE